MSNQGLRQASIRAVTSTTESYEGTFNERLLAWINGRLSASYSSLPGAMYAFAENEGADSWNGLGTFDASIPE